MVQIVAGVIANEVSTEGDTGWGESFFAGRLRIGEQGPCHQTHKTKHVLSIVARVFVYSLPIRGREYANL